MVLLLLSRTVLPEGELNLSCVGDEVIVDAPSSTTRVPVGLRSVRRTTDLQDASVVLRDWGSSALSVRQSPGGDWTHAGIPLNQLDGFMRPRASPDLKLIIGDTDPRRALKVHAREGSGEYRPHPLPNGIVHLSSIAWMAGGQVLLGTPTALVKLALDDSGSVLSDRRVQLPASGVAVGASTVWTIGPDLAGGNDGNRLSRLTKKSFKPSGEWSVGPAVAMRVLDDSVLLLGGNGSVTIPTANAVLGGPKGQPGQAEDFCAARSRKKVAIATIFRNQGRRELVVTHHNWP